MLTIFLFALLLAIPGALGIMRFEGAGISIPVFSLDGSGFSSYSNPSKSLNALVGLSMGTAFGLLLAFGIGFFATTHSIVVEKTKLVPIHQNGRTFYVGVSAEEEIGFRG